MSAKEKKQKHFYILNGDWSEKISSTGEKVGQLHGIDRQTFGGDGWWRNYITVLSIVKRQHQMKQEFGGNDLSSLESGRQFIRRQNMRFYCR